MFDLIYGLNKLNVDNAIVCFKNSPVEDMSLNKMVTCYSFFKVKAYSLTYAKTLKKYVEAFVPDIIHLHTSNAVTAYVISDILYKLKTSTVFSKKGISGKVSALSVFKYNYKGIQKVICVSKAVENAFKNVLKPKNQHKLCVVYDGIKVENIEPKPSLNLREEFDIPESTFIIGNIANHAKAKDLVTLVKAANELVYEMNVKNVRFIQVGKEGKHTKDFLPLIEAYKLKPFFIMAGYQEQAMGLISQFDIYAMSSVREGLPLTIYEAFLQKRPVVSTKAGGIPEAIKHQENGLLVDVKDYKKLAENLKYLLENKHLQKEFSNISYKLLFDKFTTKQLAEQTLTIYKDIS